MGKEKEKRNENEVATANEKINDLIQKNRTAVLTALISVGVILAGFIAYYSISSVLRNRANAAVEELGSRYESLRDTITADTATAIDDEIAENDDSTVDLSTEASADALDNKENPEIAALTAELEAFAKTARGYAGGKACGILADIYSRQRRFEDAQAAWVNAALKAKKTYLEPISWYNAAATAEGLGNYEQAVEYYTQSLGAQANFPLAAQSQFSVGRLKEEMGDRDGAIEAYRALITAWPNDTVWPNMARSRIIALEIGKL